MSINLENSHIMSICSPVRVVLVMVPHQELNTEAGPIDTGCGCGGTVRVSSARITSGGAYGAERRTSNRVLYFARLIRPDGTCRTHSM